MTGAGRPARAVYAHLGLHNASPPTKLHQLQQLLHAMSQRPIHKRRRNHVHTVLLTGRTLHADYNRRDSRANLNVCSQHTDSGVTGN